MKFPKNILITFLNTYEILHISAGLILSLTVFCVTRIDDSFELNSKFIRENYMTNVVIKEHWKFDLECKKFKVMFGKGLPTAYVASFPRSGNSWTLYLIESASGLVTNGIEPGSDFNDSSVIITKTHGRRSFGGTKRSICRDKSEPVILLIRIIEKSIFSFWSFKYQEDRKLKHFFEAPFASYNTTRFREYVKRTIQKWKYMNKECLLYCKTLLVIFYENLLRDPLEEVTKVMNFLGYPIDPGRMNCLNKYPQGFSKRNITIQIDPFTKPEKKMMASSMLHIVNLLERRSFEVPKEYFDYISQHLL